MPVYEPDNLLISLRGFTSVPPNDGENFRGKAELGNAGGCGARARGRRLVRRFGGGRQAPAPGRGRDAEEVGR